MSTISLHVGDCLESLRRMLAESVHCCVTSPPYFGLRDYGQDGQIGLEATPDAFVARLVEVFREVRRVLHPSGVLFVNIGDSYASDTKGSGGRTAKQSTNAGSFMTPRAFNHGCKPKDLIGIPWMLAFALRADGWYLRQEIIWHKESAMPESVRDRPSRCHEQVFLLAKSSRYFWDADAIREPAAAASEARYQYAFSGAKKGLTRPDGGERMVPEGMREFSGGRNSRSVWTINPKPFSANKLGITDVDHFAAFPGELVKRCIEAGSSAHGVCSACGAPWARVVERAGCDMAARYERGEPVRHGINGAASSKASNVGGFSGNSRQLGFAPSCACAAPIRPAVILDPFAGTGTTGDVAVGCGRDAVLCELSPDYARIIRARCGLWIEEEVPASEPVPSGPWLATRPAPDLAGAARVRFRGQDGAEILANVVAGSGTLDLEATHCDGRAFAAPVAYSFGRELPPGLEAIR